MQGFEYIDVAGTPIEMGRQLGSQMATKIHALAEERMRLWLARDENIARERALSIGRDCLEIQASWNRDVHEEFIGISEGADIDPSLLYIANGFTDLRDIQGSSKGIYGCTSFALEPTVTLDKQPLCGQTWDMHNSAEDFLIIIRRRPKKGLNTLALTTAGCLTLTGMNSAGLAMGNNNVVPDHAQPGVMYLAILHSAISQDNLEDACRVITDAPRASGHHYYLTDADGSVIGIETTALRSDELKATDGIYVHANHYISPTLKGFSRNKPGVSSLSRQGRLTSILKSAFGSIDIAFLQKALSDRENEPHCICRHGENEAAKTCAAIIMAPSQRQIWVVAGPPDMGSWHNILL